MPQAFHGPRDSKDEADRRSEELAAASQLLGTAVRREAILITDAQIDLPGPHIVFVNPAFTEMTGYTREEILGKTPRILQGPNTNRGVLDRLRQNLSSGELFEGETINYRKNGSEFVLDWQVAPIRSAAGEITHYLSVQRDVTEKRRAELTANRLAAIVEFSEDAIIGKDLNGIVNSWNKGAEKLFGYSEEEMIGAPITRLIPDGSDSAKRPKYSKTLGADTELKPFETIRKTKSGKLIEVSVTASPIKDSSGTIVRRLKISSRRKLA